MPSQGELDGHSPRDKALSMLQIEKYQFLRKIKELVSSFLKLITPRIISTCLSLAIFTILARHLGRDNFAQFQVPFSLGSVILWIIDLGLLKSCIKYLAESRIYEASQAWFLRLCLILLLSSQIYLIGAVLRIDIPFILLMITGLLDSSADSLIALQQNHSDLHFRIYNSTYKKLIQLLLLLPFTMNDDSGNLSNIAIVIAIPALLSHFFESVHFQLARRMNVQKIVRNSLKFWFGSGGNYLSNFDNTLISIRGGTDLLVSLAAGRRIGNAILISSQALNGRIFYNVSKFRRLKFPGYKIAYLSILLTFIQTLVVGIFINEILTRLTGIVASRSDFLLVYAILLAVNLSCVNGLLNSILSGMNQFKFSNIGAYTSTGIYLLCLASMPKNLSLEFVIAFSIVLNHFIEFLFLFFGFRKFRRLRHQHYSAEG